MEISTHVHLYINSLLTDATLIINNLGIRQIKDIINVLISVFSIILYTIMVGEKRKKVN